MDACFPQEQLNLDKLENLCVRIILHLGFQYSCYFFAIFCISTKKEGSLGDVPAVVGFHYNT